MARWRIDLWSQASTLDRDGVSRADRDLLEQLWRHPDARVVDVGPRGEVSQSCPLVPTQGGLDPASAYLGRCGVAPTFARPVGQAPADAVTMADGAFSPGLVEVVAAAEGITAWQRSSRYCEGCAAELSCDVGGFSKSCPGCGRVVFPRIDPAMIVAILDNDDRLLLAHQVKWQQRRVSILAGFVEAGESAEQACHREVMEEASLHLSDLRVVGTQPWPFPRSLMVAFVARAQGDPVFDGVELEWGDWFTRDRLRREAASGAVTLPSPGSVASSLISSWLSGDLPSPES